MILHLVVSTLLENDTIIYVLQIQNLVYNHTFTRIKSRIFFTIIINGGKWNSSGCLSRSRFTFNLKGGKRITFHEVGRQFVMATWSSTQVLERGHWCHPGCWCNAVPHSGNKKNNHHQPDRHGLGTLSTKLNAPSNFMHTLGNDCFSLGLVQIPRPFRPSLSLFFSPFRHTLCPPRFERHLMYVGTIIRE